MQKFVDAKDPNAVEWYEMDWTTYLNDGATISTSTWTVPAGLTVVTDQIKTGNLITQVKFSGGTHGTDYECLNRVTTSDGETLDLTGILRVRSL
jgi:hypothetical protein